MKKNTTIACLLLSVGLLGACQKDIQSVSNQPNPNTSSQTIENTTVHKLMIDGKATYVNEKDGMYFYASDIILTPEQFNKLKMLSNNNTMSSTERSAIVESFSDTWPNGIVYYEKPTIRPALENPETLPKAIKMITDYVPEIRFIERTNQPEYVKFDYGLFSGSASPLGWSKGRVNTIYFGQWYDPGILAHEIMHTLGVEHEQSRPDRDNYIRINWENLNDVDKRDFNINLSYAGYGDFDFNSIMMYSPYAFSKNNQPTISRKNGSSYSSQRSKLSEGDIKGLKHLYAPLVSSPFEPGIYNIKAKSNQSFVLDVSGGNIADGTKIILYSGNGTQNQKFFFRKTEDGYFTLRSALDYTKALTVNFNGTTPHIKGSDVVLETFQNKDSQKWVLHNLGNLGYGFAPKIYDFLRLTIKNGGIYNSNSIIVDEPINNDSQRFTLTLN